MQFGNHLDWSGSAMPHVLYLDANSVAYSCLFIRQNGGDSYLQ